jgi:hypothetical protein
MNSTNRVHLESIQSTAVPSDEDNSFFVRKMGFAQLWFRGQPVWQSRERMSARLGVVRWLKVQQRGPSAFHWVSERLTLPFFSCLRQCAF